MRKYCGIALCLLSAASGLIGVGYGYGCRRKYKDICYRLDIAIDNISDDIDVDIPEKIVNKAVNEAVSKRVRERVDRAVDMTVNSIKKDINDQVSLAVKAIYPDIRKSCTEQITNEVLKINSKDLKDAIREEATEKMLEKFDGELDDILDKFNTDLDNISKIYGSITKKLTGSESNNLKISLG